MDSVERYILMRYNIRMQANIRFARILATGVKKVYGDNAKGGVVPIGTVLHHLRRWAEFANEETTENLIELHNFIIIHLRPM